jgi:Tfp pilus assembly protein PilF
LYQYWPNRVAAGLLFGLLLTLTGCCSFGSRCNKQQVIAARELTSLGLNALHRGRPDEASRFLEQACEASPEDARIRRHLASSYVQNGRRELAIHELKQALDQSSSDPALHVELGKLYLEQGQPHAAREQAMLALQLNRQLADGWLLKGQSEKAANQLDLAIESLHRSAHYNPECRETRLQLAECWALKGEPLRALTAIEIHNASYADDQIPIHAVELTGQVLMDLKQYFRATEWLADAVRRNDATPETWILLSRAQWASGDPSAAQLTALSAQQAFPENSALPELLATMDQAADVSLHAAR